MWVYSYLAFHRIDYYLKIVINEFNDLITSEKELGLD